MTQSQKNQLQHYAKIIARHIFISFSSVVFFVTIIWNIGKPHLEGFVQEIVRTQQVQAAEAVTQLKGKIDGVEKTVDELRTTQIRQGAIIENLEDTGKETRADVRQILLTIRR